MNENTAALIGVALAKIDLQGFCRVRANDKWHSVVGHRQDDGGWLKTSDILLLLQAEEVL